MVSPRSIHRNKLGFGPICYKWVSMTHMTVPHQSRFLSLQSVHVQESTQAGISPGKRLNMRSECINQLDKWHALMERVAISMEQYREFKMLYLEI